MNTFYIFAACKTKFQGTMKGWKIYRRWLFGAMGYLLLMQGIVAQDFIVKGTVKDPQDEPLIGATVIVENTDIGTVTDFEGKYELHIPVVDSQVTVVYSYVGYAPVKKLLSPQAGVTLTVDVVLEEDFIGLEEVVVTGSATELAKKYYGNAISTVGEADIERSPALSVDRLMSGKIAGALINQNSGNPDGGVSVTLRGYSTIVGKSDPLYIIDGVIIDNSSDQLVDLGGYTQNRLIDIDPNDIERIEIIKGASAAAIYGSLASNGIVQIFTKRGRSGKPRISYSTSFRVNTLRKKIHENSYPYVWKNKNDLDDTTRVPTERYQMQDYVFSPGYGAENSFSLSGGVKRTKYYLSLNQFYNEGIIDNTWMKRYSGRLNIDQEINRWFSLSMGLNYIQTRTRNVPNGGISKFYGALTGMNFNNNNFNPEPDENGNYKSPIGFVPNPLEAINNFKFYQNVNRIIGNLKMKFNIAQGLYGQVTIGNDWYNHEATGYIPIGSNGVKRGFARAALKNFHRLTLDATLRYYRDIGDFIQSHSAVGVNAYRDQRHYLILNSEKISPFVETVSGDITGKTDVVGERVIRGLFFQQTFGVWDQLYLTGSARWDQASPFGINARTQFYPKVSVSWLVSETPLWKRTVPMVETFKLRASYGESGNMTALRDYERFSNYADLNYLGRLGFIPSAAMGNENVKPERQRETEFGIDFSMLNNRLGGEFTYYRVKVTDLLLQIELAPTTGFSTRYENVGIMTNRGFEVLLKGVPVRSRDLTWRVQATYHQNRNRVDSIPGGMVTLARTFGIVRAINGYPLGVHYGFYYHRDENGNIWTDERGLPKRAVDENNRTLRKVIADPNPDFVASLINEVEYKDWVFRIQLDQVWGFDVFNFTDRVNSHPNFGGGHYDEDELRGKLPKGYNKAAYNIWERFIEDGSFIKLRELYAGWSFRPPLSYIRSAQVYISGRNLYSWDKYLGWDPELSTAGQSNGVRGFDFNEVPIPRTVQVGLKLQF